ATMIAPGRASLSREIAAIATKRAPSAARQPTGLRFAPPSFTKDAAALPWAVGLFVVALIVYGLTLYRTVPGGDRGEPIPAPETVGGARPPGYPLFPLLARLFALRPFESVAWRIISFSAVCDAGAAALLVLAIARWTGTVWAGLLAGGRFACS